MAHENKTEISSRYDMPEFGCLLHLLKLRPEKGAVSASPK